MTIKHDGRTFQIVKKHQRYEWTAVKDALLTKLYGQMGLKELARRFKCAQSTIIRRLRVLDLSGEKLWTGEKAHNDQILRDNYLSKTNQQLAKMIGCVHVYVSDRLTYLGLVRPRRR